MKKIFLISISTFIIIFLIGVYDILSPSKSIFGASSKILPAPLKSFIKEKIFYVPSKMKKADELSKDIESQKKIYVDAKKSSTLVYQDYIKLLDNYDIKLFKREKIKSKQDTLYELSVYKIPLLEYYLFEDKPIAYLEVIDDYLITVSGDGYFFKSIINDELSILSNFKKINSNLHEFEEYNKIVNPGWMSIKDVKVFEDNIYIAITEEVIKDCYNLSILKSKINQIDYFNFEKIYNMEQCQSSNVNEFLGWQSGGRLEIFENYILLSVGDFRNRNHPQDKNSLFGKLVAIDLNTKENLIVSMGHRNIQGLLVSDDIVISTEHGPAGGDEINVHKNIFSNNDIPNYGWPLASYGKHYQKVINLNRSEGTLDTLINIAPLKKSHKENGFIEPIKYFAPGSVAASEIEQSNQIFDKNFSNDFYFGVLRNNSKYRGRLYHFKFDENYEKILFEDEIILNQRIRDIIIPKNKDKMYLLLESIPAIGIVKKLQ